MKLFDITVKEM